MSARLPLLPALLMLATAGGCALFGGRTCEGGYRFPERFDAIQVITVEQEGERHQFLASVRRVGPDYEFVLLDPVIQRPLVEAGYRAGEWTERSNLPEGVEFPARELFGAIRQLFEATCFSREEDGLGFRSDRFRFSFVEPSPGGCSFPASIGMKPRLGDAVRVSAETRDVACGE